MKEFQEKVKQFNEDREWSRKENMKDYLLNMTEEIGEFWNLVKWVDTETYMKILEKKHEDAEDFIGDMLYLVFKVSYLCNVNPEKALQDVLNEYEERFPIEKSKGKNANLHAGGWDGKHTTEE